MGFIQAIVEFLQSIFMSSSPEVKKRTELRKVENDLRVYQPQIFKNSQLTANFAELFRILYEKSKTIDEILSKTIATEDKQRNGLFENQLIITGFTPETQEKIEKLNYENRKQAIIDSKLPLNKQLEIQKKSFETVLSQLNGKEFSEIDRTIQRLQQLSDICRFNYINIIKLFDSQFDGLTSVALTNAHSVAPESVVNLLQDFYYIASGFKVESSDARAVVALATLLHGENLENSMKDNILECLKKINSIVSRILKPEILKKIIILGKSEPAVVLESGSYRAESLKRFIEFTKGRFDSDTERIKGEIKDYNISNEVQSLFGNDGLQSLDGYNMEVNAILRQDTPFSFIWITPMQVLKSFVVTYMPEVVRNLLETIVIEGFFEDAKLKSAFSDAVYACNEIGDRISEFEKSFGRDGKNDQATLVSLISDSKRNPDFLKKVGATVDNINAQAHKIIQDESTNVFKLYKMLGDLLVDSKKSTSTVVSNIKVLLSSTRNRDGSGVLEQQFELWKQFLSIMKNYAIIGEIENNA